MNLLLKLTVALLSVASLAFGAIELEGDVLVLDDTNFAEATAAHDKLLVEFYAPWCGHCKTLAPEWAKAATALKESPLKLAKVDATIATELANTHGIKGFPTIKYFKNGVPSDYDGGRTEKEIVSWVNKKSGPPAVTVTTVAELEKLEAANEAVVVGLFKSLESDLAKSFLVFAGATTLDAPFIISSSPEVLTKLGAKKDAIVVLKVFDEKRDDFALGATIDSEELTTFLAAKTTPLIQDYTPSSSKKIFGSDIKKHALYFVNKDAEGYSASATYELLTESAKAHKGEMLFITVGADNTGILGYFDLKETDLPKFIIIDMSNAIKKFPLDVPSADLTAKAIGAHAAAFVAGTLTPTLKSEEPTPEDVAQPVKVVKGKSFNDLVLNTKKDVLLEIYAPWCGHCKTLAPIYDEVGEELKDDDTVVLAKMDGTANEVAEEDFATSGFPSLFWVPGDTKKVVKYEGGRTKEDILAYIKEHATKTYVAGHEEL